jgi:hypothetical protein
MSSNQYIELEIREPTGLSLGTFDLFIVRQKIYEGEFAPTCEYKTTEGEWATLESRDDLSEVFWLLDGRNPSADPTKRATFGGWKTKGGENSKSAALTESGVKPEKGSGLSALRGLTGRFMTKNLPKLPTGETDE